MEEDHVLETREETVMKVLAPLIANGANGELAAHPAETEIKIGKLKLKPYMEEDHVLEMQGETVMSDNVLKRYLQKVIYNLINNFNNEQP